MIEFTGNWVNIWNWHTVYINNEIMQLTDMVMSTKTPWELSP